MMVACVSYAQTPGPMYFPLDYQALVLEREPVSYMFDRYGTSSHFFLASSSFRVCNMFAFVQTYLVNGLSKLRYLTVLYL